MLFEALILIALSIYFFVGSRQILVAFRVKRKANLRKFLKKDISISVIIPIRERDKTTYKNLKSVCRQKYPDFEVIFVAEKKTHSAFRIARELTRRYPNVKVVLSGEHDPKKNIAKCHNLIYGAAYAKGAVLLFGDSDVNYSEDWIFKMTSPLGEIVNGKQIDAVTSPFFIEPEGFSGKFIAQSVSLVTFTANFTLKEQMFPPFASGASIAISRNLFDELEIAKIWGTAFNDDLILADAVVDSGYYIYSQLANLNHPNEAFSSFSQTKDKMVRWVITISSFGHNKLRSQVPAMVAKNLQFQVALILGIIIYLFGFFWILALGILAAGYVYCVVYRYMVGQIIEERGMSFYYVLAPISITTMMIFYLVVRMFFRTFFWEGDAYTVYRRHSF
ncbi:MAG: glycosyltransferase [Thermoplasmata archaeon]|nr:MAG: glycosyltransferase [Thermoplasmata archaeon]